MNLLTQRKQLLDSFYSLLPPDSAVPDSLPLVLEFKPELSLYVIKSLRRNVITLDEYARAKATVAYQLDLTTSRSQSLSHFMPKNIIKRMNFRSADTEEEDDSNSVDSDGAS